MNLAGQLVSDPTTEEGESVSALQCCAGKRARQEQPKLFHRTNRAFRTFAIDTEPAKDLC